MFWLGGSSQICKQTNSQKERYGWQEPENIRRTYQEKYTMTESCLKTNNNIFRQIRYGQPEPSKYAKQMQKNILRLAGA